MILLVGKIVCGKKMLVVNVFVIAAASSGH